MPYMNNCYLMGHLGADPIAYTAQNGSQIVRFNLAINNPKDKNGNHTTTWVPIICFGKIGESVMQNLKKGNATLVTGEINIQNRTDENGKNCKNINIIARRAVLVSYKSIEHGNINPDTEDIPF